ncbi:chemotaxis protein CheW [Roseomonas sp. 18066]|uniref:chemotaxis protein CheW n=1 Tax=Roseomonas sp. 18066 TaxID=2681412 RepID=UPI001F3AF5CB|nr:chemotaxis protein CheW [Roseomonas sp. 18066]
MGAVVGGDAYLLFRLGSRRCALAQAAVREVLPLPRLFRPPALPKPMAGYLNLGGAAVPVVDLAKLFGIATSAEADQALYRHILLIDGPDGHAPLGLLVDRVLDLLRVVPERLRAVAPEATLNGCAIAELETAEGFVHLLAADRLLLSQEAAALAALQEGAAARLAEWSGP